MEQNLIAAELKKFRLMKYDLKNRFNLTIEQYEYVNKQQGGVCAICKKKPEKNLAVDVHQTTNIPRGLLCNRCKRALAYLYDDTAILQSAIDYLTDFEARLTNFPRSSI